MFGGYSMPPARGEVAAVVSRLRDEAVRCRLLPQGAELDPVLQTLFEGFAAEIAGLRRELDGSLDQNRRNLLAHFLGLGYRRQPAQALAVFSMDQPGALDDHLVLRGRSTRTVPPEGREFRLVGSFRLPRLSLAGAAYTGPGGFVWFAPDPECLQRSLDPVHVGETRSPGAPALHIGLRGVPPRAGEVLSLAVIPPGESQFRLYAEHSRDLADFRRWLCESAFSAGSGLPLEPPRRLDELGRETELRDLVADRLPTREAAFHELLERHVHSDLILAFPGPLAERLVSGPAPEELRRAAEDLSFEAAAWGDDVRWFSLRLPSLPGDEPLRLFQRIAVNVLPVAAYEVFPPERQQVSLDNVSPVTGMLPIPLTPDAHQALQRDDWVVDRVEWSGETLHNVHTHVDPQGLWYGLLSDWRSSTLYLHLPRPHPPVVGAVDFYLGRLVGEEANGARLDPNPYNRSEFPGLDTVHVLTEFVGGTSEQVQDAEIPWEGIGSFLRTRDRLITRWDYEGFIRRFDPRIVACEFDTAAIPSSGRFVPGIAITVHFDQALEVPREETEVAVISLAREVDRRALLGSHVEIRLGEPAMRVGRDS